MSLQTREREGEHLHRDFIQDYHNEGKENPVENWVSSKHSMGKWACLAKDQSGVHILIPYMAVMGLSHVPAPQGKITQENQYLGCVIDI